jgi:Zn-dependent protease with chaperone function
VSSPAVDFFARQHEARGTSARLVALFVLAVVSIIVVVDVVVLLLTRNGTSGYILGWVIAASAVTVLVIAGGMLAKMATLRSGGAAVALSVGAVPVDPTTSDPQLRRLINVVEEMSIASGVPMPRLFVLPREEGINAFAAGFTPADAAITVTAGSLERLNRDELQGVVGHEFSHILNGDMRLNVRLIGLLAGILLLGIVGLRVLQFGGGRSRDSKASPVLFIAIAFLVLGFVGQFFAQLIQAAVSRQREWLADASSVQFTRQSAGLVGALKKIAGLPTGSALRDTVAERQVNHMLFGEGKRSFSQLYATHPPLLERIKALEPGFRPEKVRELRAEFRASPPNGLAEDAARGFAAASATPAPTVAVTPETVSSRVGSFGPDDLARGAAISARLPDELRRLAGQPSTARDLVLALLLDADADVRARQLTLTGPAAGRLYPQVANLPEVLRLPVIELAMPSVAAGPPDQVHAVIDLADQLARADGTYTLFEYCAVRLVGSYLRDALSPAARSTPGRADVRTVQQAAVTLLAAVATAGNPDSAAAQRAFTTGMSRLLPGAAPPDYAPPASFAALDAVWDPLDALDPRHKRPLVEALVAAVNDDGVLAVAEVELLRTACALLHCPLPAMIA